MRLKDALKLLGGDPTSYVETYITLPLHKRPASWKLIDHPVVKLEVSLYGHPMAVMLWEKHCDQALVAEGFRK